MKKKQRQVDPKVRTFFLLAFPTLLIIALAMLNPDTWWAWILIAVYQFIYLKQFIDKYHEVM